MKSFVVDEVRSILGGSGDEANFADFSASNQQQPTYDEHSFNSFVLQELVATAAAGQSHGMMLLLIVDCPCCQSGTRNNGIILCLSLDLSDARKNVKPSRDRMDSMEKL